MSTSDETGLPGVLQGFHADEFGSRSDWK